MRAPAPFLAAAALFTFAACATVPLVAGNGLVLPPAPAGAPTAPGPSPRYRSFDAAEMNALCERCHTDVAAEWRASLHREAHTDPAYQAQFATEPLPFCTSCHAPEADAKGPVPEALSRLGVGCVTCHVVGDQILAAPKEGGTGHDGEHHPLTRTPTFAGAAACGGCHEFAFPDSRASRPPLLMQSTMTEHATSAHAAESCASCHMPWAPGGEGGRHRDHTFSASRDEAFVRSAIVVEEPPITAGTFTLVLRPGRVGHAFPTGDMLRRLALTIEILAADGRVTLRRERFLARHFGFTRRPDTLPRRVLVNDDRVGAGTGPVVVEQSVEGAPPGARLHYVLRYERVGDPRGDEGGLPGIEGSVLLAERTIPLP